MSDQSFTSCFKRRAFLHVTLPLMFAGAASAGTLAAGYRETMSLSVPEAVTSNHTGRLLISEGSFSKSGPGTLAVAATNLTLQSGGSLVVCDGSLLISCDTNTVLAHAPCPTEVMAQAAFWVDATKNVITVSSNGNTYADTWLDARETSTVAPFTYTRAVANWALTNCSPQLISNAGVSGTLPSVWFGRYGSLRTMTWTTPANTTADISKIYHVFAMHGVFQSYGYIFGAMNGTPDFHITEYQTGNINAMIWAPSEWSTTAVRQGRTYLDGERIDGTLTQPKTGWQLLEVATSTKLPHAANFFNDRSIITSGKRVGGDYLCEVAVFTNRLSETDRLRVQSYLMQKWRGPQKLTSLAISASAEGTVVANVATNSTLNLRLNGDGTLQKQGTGVAILEDLASTANLFRSAVIQAGTLDARVPIPLTLTPGSRVATSNTLIAVTHDVDADHIVKEGAGTVTITTLPTNLAHLAIEGGRLVLTPPKVNTSVVPAIFGSVPNATFEAEQISTNHRLIADGETYYGWTASVPSTILGSPENSAIIFNRSSNVNKWPCDFGAPEGKQVLALKRDASISTTLSLPAAGIYDLSFYTSARNFLSGRHEFDLCIIDGQQTNCVALVQTFNLAYNRQNFRLPWLGAGNHTLLFHRTVTGVDTLGTIDEIKVARVPDAKSNIVKIYNGDFELVAYPRNTSAFTHMNQAPGWVFTPAANNEVAAGLVMPALPSYFYTPSTPYGSVMLGLVSNGCASTSLTLPAGTYKLQGGVCNWPCNLNGKPLAGTQTTAAEVRRGSGDSTLLGNVATAASILTTTTWPTAFSVTNNETVTLLLTGQTKTSAALIDNLELVRQTTPIVQNGGFEADAHWTFVSNKALQPKDEAGYNSLAQANDYGDAIYDGTRRLLLVQTGAAVQEIQIPAPGLYRLVFHAAQRTSKKNSNIYGRNPVRAWLAQNNVTNVIDWTRVDDIALVRREFLFHVAEAGAYQFGLQGMTDNSAQFPGVDQNALIDGVVIEAVTNLDDTGFELPTGLSLAVAKGAGVQLSFTSTQKVDQVRLDGHFVSGIISGTTYPSYFSGPGALYAPPKGLILLIR